MSDAFNRYLYHYTTAADWERSLADGEHRVSGRGMTLADQGFIHLCYESQRAGVWQRFWAAINEPVVLLMIDPDDLDADLVDENGSVGSELFPHLYGPLPVSAVVQVEPVGTDGEPAANLPP